MSTKIVHSELAAQLIVDGCVPMALGEKHTPPTAPGQELSVAERAKLTSADPNAIPTVGKTVFYPIGDDGVFLDISPDVASVWYEGGDADKAIAVFEKALKKTYPKVRFIEERKHPGDGALKVRFYQVDTGGAHTALIETTFPAGSKPKQFVARTRAITREN